MVITDVLARNAALYGDEVCLVGVNPEAKEKREVTWREYELMETNPLDHLPPRDDVAPLRRGRQPLRQPAPRAGASARATRWPSSS